MMIRASLPFLFLCVAYSQNPLETLTIEGSALPQKTVLELSGLHMGAGIDRAAIEAACRKLEETGLFSSINFRYEPTAKNGFALTLSLADQVRLSEASIDIPGVDDGEVWRWLAGKFPAFDHRVPGNDAAQQVIARQIEGHLGAKLHAQRVVTKMEADFTTRKSITSFQPEHLPRIESMIFVGTKDLTADQANAVMQKVTADRGYTDRQFRSLLENNLRPAYEERGLYRVQFPKVTASFTDAGAVAVTTTVEEGPPYSLGEVSLTGDDLPSEQMMAAAKFRKGAIANWTEIQKSLWEMERPVKRVGYFEAVAKPERVFHDDTHVLDLKIGFAKGPLYRFGQLHINGLSPELDAKARKAWEKNPGDPYDYSYPSEFLRTFSKSVDLRQFKRYDVRAAKGPGDHTMDITLVFEPR
jgi:outer membrane protein assembly factor BamA